MKPFARYGIAGASSEDKAAMFTHTLGTVVRLPERSRHPQGISAEPSEGMQGFWVHIWPDVHPAPALGDAWRGTIPNLAV